MHHYRGYGKTNKLFALWKASSFGHITMDRRTTKEKENAAEALANK